MAPRVSARCPCLRCRAAEMAAPSGRDALTAFPLAAGLAALAGATDAYGLGFLRDLFVSFMSGNTTSLGVALGQGDWTRAWLIAWIVGLFVAGAAAGAVLSEASGRHHRAAVTLAVALTLATPLFVPHWAIGAFVLAMGALNASMDRVGEASISLTYVTGTLVKLGQGIGRTVCGKPGGWSWAWQAPMWASLLVGAVAATLVRQRLGADVLWPLPAYALMLGIAALAAERDSRPGGATASVKREAAV